MSVTLAPPPARPGRKVHRATCVAAGGLSLLGGALGLAVSPWFFALAAAGGAWLIASGVWGGPADPPKPMPCPVDPVV